MEHLHIQALDPACQIGRVLQIEKNSFNQPWTVADFEILANNDRALNVGLWRSEKLVGYSIGYVDNAEFHLASLAVEPPWRRRGYGAWLVLSALSVAQNRGCASCRLEVRPSNRAARSLYEKLGFQLTGTLSRFYTSPREDALKLEIPIATIMGTNFDIHSEGQIS